MHRLVLIVLLSSGAALAQTPAPPLFYCVDILTSGESLADQYKTNVCLSAKAIETMVKVNGVAYVQRLLDEVKAEAPPVVQPPPVIPPVYPPMNLGVITVISTTPQGPTMYGYVMESITTTRLDIKVDGGLTYTADIAPSATGNPKAWKWVVPTKYQDGKVHSVAIGATFALNGAWHYGEQLDNSPYAFHLP